MTLCLQAAGASGGLSRSKSRQLDRQHNVVVLGKDEQADLFKNTQYKHGCGCCNAFTGSSLLLVGSSLHGVWQYVWQYDLLRFWALLQGEEPAYSVLACLYSLFHLHSCSWEHFFHCNAKRSCCSITALCWCCSCRVASAVRQELLTSEKPDKPLSKQPRQLEQQQQLRDAFHQQEQPRGRRFNIFNNTAATAPAAAAQEPPDPALDDGRRRPIDDVLDDLFDDGELSQGPEEEEEPEWDFSYRRSAATAASKSVGGHLHRKHTLGQQDGPEEHEGTPEDLMDDMEADAGVQGMGQEGQHRVQEDEEQMEVAAGSSGAGPAAQEGGVEEPHAVAAKRRRMHVIASDSEDDD